MYCIAQNIQQTKLYGFCNLLLIAKVFPRIVCVAIQSYTGDGENRKNFFPR